MRVCGTSSFFLTKCGGGEEERGLFSPNFLYWNSLQALVDLKAAAAAAPDDKRIVKSIAECNKQIAESKKKDAATFKGMF